MLNPDKTDAAELIQLSLETKFFRPRAGPLFAKWVRGDFNLVQIVGDNATGKSFYRRIIQAICAEHFEPKLECIHLSMEGRSGGSYEIGIIRSMIYGSERDEATGGNTARTLMTALSTARSRTTPHVLFFDEPETGLSDEYAAGAGDVLREFVFDMPKMTKAVFVVSHRKALLNPLPHGAHALIFGKDVPYRDVLGWMNREIRPKKLDELEKRSHELYRALSKVLKEK